MITRRDTLEEFPSRNAASLTFEKIELERPRVSGMIKRFLAQANRDATGFTWLSAASAATSAPG